MAVDASIAQLSNNLMYSAMAMYASAMVAQTAELAFGSRSRIGRTAAAVPGASAGATSEATSGVRGPGAVATMPRTGVPSEPNRADVAGRIGVSLTVLAFGFHLAAVAARGIAAGRVPWGNMYEFSTAGALAVTGAYLVLLRRHDLRFLGLWVTSVVLVTLGLAVTVLYTDAGSLVPSLRSYWLVIHVSAAVLSSGAFTIAAATTVLYLLRERAERRVEVPGDAPTGYVGRLPSAAVLDRTAYRLHAFGFPIWTFAVIAGAIWAENAWGRYWGWDPKETWAFITWVVYACYLHARATAGWRGRAAAAIALVGYATFLFNYFGVNIWISGLHSYAGI